MPIENASTTPPDAFALAWRRERELNTRKGRRVLFLAEDTTAFTAAYKLCRDELRAVGYAYAETAKREGDWSCTVWVPAFWLDPNADPAVAARAAMQAEAALREAEIQMQAMCDAEWHRNGASRQEAIDRLRELYEGAPWAFSPSVVTTVEDLIEVERPTAGQAHFADSLRAQAELNVLRAEARLKGWAPEVELQRAADPEVRADVLTACRALSERDDDRAQERNNRGWSQATSWTGHLLAGKRELTQREAAHALRLVYKHRRQLEPELAQRLYSPVNDANSPPEATNAMDGPHAGNGNSA